MNTVHAVQRAVARHGLHTAAAGRTVRHTDTAGPARWTRQTCAARIAARCGPARGYPPASTHAGTESPPPFHARITHGVIDRARNLVRDAIRKSGLSKSTEKQ